MINETTCERWRFTENIIIEKTRLSYSCKCDTLHCQLCRFAIRCSEIEIFQKAAAKLTKNMINNRYIRVKLRNKLHNFKSSLFERSPITTIRKGSKKPERS